MKKGLKILVLLIVLSIGLGITGCKKDERKKEINKETKVEEQFDGKVVGTWERSIQEGTITYQLKKTKTGTYTLKDGQTKSSQKITFEALNGVLQITYEDGVTYHYPYRIIDDTLIIENTLGEETYHRIVR